MTPDQLLDVLLSLLLLFACVLVACLLLSVMMAFLGGLRAYWRKGRRQ